MPDVSAVHPVVFAYNFPHKKTQDFLQRLVLLGMRPLAVLAADPVRLNLPVRQLRVKPRHCDLIHPQEICHRLEIPYHVVDHGGPRCVDLLARLSPRLGVVAGARVLPPEVIERFTVGIVNFHPGLIPEVRGLDALSWAIYHGLPLGVTAHLIDRRVDAGHIVERRVIEEFSDDALVDLSLRLSETQVQMLATSIPMAVGNSDPAHEPVHEGRYRPPFPAELIPAMQARFEQRHERPRKSA